MKRRTLALVGAALAAVLMMSACSKTPSGHPSASSGGTLTIAVVQDNNSFDTADLQIGNAVQYWDPVYDTLILMDTSYKPQPNLATEWSYNDDATVLDLKLRDDVTFTDGERFNAAAVKANIEHLSAGTGQNSHMGSSIEKIELVGDYEVKLHLSAPNPALIEYLGSVLGAMASPKAIQAGALATDPVGSGPYVLDRDASVAGSQYVYTRNDDYWNKDAFPYDKVVLKPITDETARLNALKSGQVNAAPINASSVQEAKSSGLGVNVSDALNWAGITIADRAGAVVPALSNVKVRQAINYAIDNKSILDKIMLGFGDTTHQIFGKASDAFDPDLDKAYSYDPDKAKDLLADAGYADGFTVTMPDPPGNATVDAVIGQELAAVGITVNWDKLPAGNSVAVLQTGKYPMFYFNTAQNSTWKQIQNSVAPTAPWNTSKSDDPKLDELIHAVQYATPGDDQAKAGRALNKWLVDNAWFAPMFTGVIILATDANTHVDVQPQNATSFTRDFTPAG